MVLFTIFFSVMLIKRIAVSVANSQKEKVISKVTNIGSVVFLVGLSGFCGSGHVSLKG